MKRGMMALIFLAAAGGLVVMVLRGLAELKTAAALEHTARAVQAQATAGAVSSVGFSVVIVALVVLVLALAAVVVWLGRKMAWMQAQISPDRYLSLQPGQNARRSRPASLPTGDGRWLPGPNARWGKALTPGPSPIPGKNTGDLRGEREKIWGIGMDELERALQIARALDGQAGSYPVVDGSEDDWNGLF